LRAALPLLCLFLVVWLTPRPASAAIQTGVSLVGTNNVSPGTVCDVGSGTYTSSPTDIWGQVIVGTTGRTYICVHNLGSAAYTVRITSTLPTPDGALTSPQSGSAIMAGAYSLIEFDLTVPTSAKPGQVSFTITFRSR
jgi:hypothetical protein